MKIFMELIDMGIYDVFVNGPLCTQWDISNKKIMSNEFKYKQILTWKLYFNVIIFKKLNYLKELFSINTTKNK